MAQNGVSSILVADFGSVHTRAVLIDAVDGVYRLVARGESRTTDGYPVHDLAVGFDRVVRQLTDATGRQFIAEGGHIITPEKPDRSGVDVFGVTASIGRPLRAVLVGLTPEMSIASALRATEGAYIEVAAIISLEDGLDEEGRLNAILVNAPDLLFITGGTDNGAQTAVIELAKTAKLAITLQDKPRRPTVVYSGNGALIEEIGEMFMEVATFLVADNVRPALDQEDIDSARIQLGAAFDRYKEQRIASFALIGAMSQTGVVPTGQGYDILAEYLGKMRRGNVALLDVGSAASTLAMSIDRRVRTSIRTDLGLGHSAPLLLENVGFDAVRRWLPFNMTASGLTNYALNKSLRPASVPGSVRDVYMEHALLKAAGQALISGASATTQYGLMPFGLIIGAGAAMTGTGNPAYDALLLIDAIQPIGVTELRADPYGLISAVGAIALRNPEAVVQLMDDNNLVQLGTCVSPLGRPRKDRTAMKVAVKFQDGSQIKETVRGGHIFRCPLPVGETAEVRVSCSAGLTMNNKRRVKFTAQGGLAGIIFDGRGRALPLANDAKTRAELLPMWVHEASGNPLVEIEESWFDVMIQDKVSEAAAQAAPKPSTKRRGLFGRGRKKDQRTDMDSMEASEDELSDFLDDLSENEGDELSELRDVLS